MAEKVSKTRGMASQPQVELVFSFAPKLSIKSLPVKPGELVVVFSHTLKALSKDAKFLKAKASLGNAHRKLSLYLCSDAEMRGFQKNYRSLDRTTDVLSFPTLEMTGDDLKSIPQTELSLGDLIISLVAVKRGAKRGKRTVRDEFVEVFIHGILHLLGYDHVLTNVGTTKREALKMRALQKKLFLDLSSRL